MTTHDCSPDGEDRIQDFLARHGGAGNRGRTAGDIIEGVSGWTEVYAADGHVLRCEWSSFGSRRESQYSEIAPST